MSIRVLNILVYMAMAGLALIVHLQVRDLQPVIPGDTGSGFFPSALAWLIIGLCGVGAVKTSLSGDDERLEIKNGRRILITLGVLAIWVVAWSYLGHFYLLQLLMLFGLFTYYRMETGLTRRRLLEHVLLAGGVTLLCWLVFNQLIYIDL